MVKYGKQGIIEKNSAQEKQADQALVFVGIMRHKEFFLSENSHGVEASLLFHGHLLICHQDTKALRLDYKNFSLM